MTLYVFRSQSQCDKEEKYSLSVSAITLHIWLQTMQLYAAEAFCLYLNLASPCLLVVAAWYLCWLSNYLNWHLVTVTHFLLFAVGKPIMCTVSLKSHGADYCLSLFATYCLQTIQQILKLKSKKTA